MGKSPLLLRPSRHRLCASILGAAFAFGLAVGSAAAQTPEPTPPVDFAQGADDLRPGQYVWTPDVSPTGPMTIYVDLSRQVAAVYRGGVRIGVTTISSGREGYETPTGVFRIMSKDAHHHSNRYDNAPMPFSQRLTDDGVALHAGRVPGYPESHGCVHLPYSFAKALFAQTRIGVAVVVTDGEGSEPVAPSSPTTTASSEIAAAEMDNQTATVLAKRD